MILLFVLMLFVLWLGSRHGGLALGAISGPGLAVMVFVFGLKPDTPPTDAIYNRLLV
jgi:anaerobic C4-dicarboxylate transporter DcuB